MTSDTHTPETVEKLLDTPDLASALESEQFKKFLDQVPIAIAVCQRRSKTRPRAGVIVGHLWRTHETAGRA
jgi:hypothetical protein